MMNFLKCVVLFALSSVFLCACSSTNTDVETIEFSSWGSITEVSIIKKVISDFEKENSNIKIKFIHIPQNYFQKIHLLFASNTAPDVIFMNNLYLPIYANQLEDISQYVEQKEFYRPAIEGMSYDGKIYAIPRDVSNLLFYVNTDILSSKNISIPTSNWKIEDLLEIGKKVTEDNIWGIGKEDKIYWALPYLNYYGGGILEDDCRTEIINTKESTKGINLYHDLSGKYHIAPTKSEIGSSTLAQMFLEKKIVFYLSGRWMYPKISEMADFNWQMLEFPAGEKLQPCDVSGWAISKNSKHKEAALKFVNYISNEKSIEYFTQTGLIVPARIKISYKLNNPKHNEKAFLNAIKISSKTPINKDYNKLIDKINSEKF